MSSRRLESIGNPLTMESSDFCNWIRSNSNLPLDVLLFTLTVVPVSDKSSFMTDMWYAISRPLPSISTPPIIFLVSVRSGETTFLPPMSCIYGTTRPLRSFLYPRCLSTSPSTNIILAAILCFAQKSSFPL